MILLMGTKSGKRSDHGPHRQILYVLAGFLNHLIQPFSGSVASLFVLRIHGSRSHQQIPVHRRRHQNAFAVLTRQGKDHSRYMAARRFVQQTVIPSARCDPDLLFADHIVDHIRVDTGRIDYALRLELPLIRLEQPAAFRLPDTLYFGVKPKLHPVDRRILRKRDIHAKRTDDPRRRSIQGRHRIVRNIRFHLPQLFFFHYAQSRYTIGYASVIERLQVQQIFRIPADHQRADPLEFEIQLL